MASINFFWGSETNLGLGLEGRMEVEGGSLFIGTDAMGGHGGHFVNLFSTWTSNQWRDLGWHKGVVSNAGRCHGQVMSLISRGSVLVLCSVDLLVRSAAVPVHDL
eukprot:scaffold697580_cov90-Attheya_sp.AAC.1